MRTGRAANSVSGRRGWNVSDWLVPVLAVLGTAVGSTGRLAGWLPHAAIPFCAVGQGLTLVLTGRRRVPMAALAGTTVVGVFLIVAGYPAGPACLGADVAAYAVARHWGEPGGERVEQLGVLVRGAVATATAAAALVVATMVPTSRIRSAPWGSSGVVVIVASAWILGYAIRTRRAYVAELLARAARLEAEEGERAARAVAEERLRIARELHDVVGHSISLITVQAEAASRSVRTNPQAVPGFLATISATGREALEEMRHVLAVLRPDAEAELSPQPGLGDLDDLVERMASSGLRVRLDVQPMELPPGMGLAVYRIVQESLTNVLKHAGPGARGAVTVERGPGSLRVSVLDDGVGPAGPRLGAAHGIVGMRERVAVYGGTLRTGPGAGRGFQVEAVIPLSGQERR